MVTVKLFAMFRNKVGKENVELPLDKEISLNEFKDILKGHLPPIADYLTNQNLLISVNQEVATPDTLIKDGDEIAILPPFSGG